MGALNKITSGDCIVWENTTGSAVDSKDVVVVGTSTLGIAAADIAISGFGNVDVKGVFELDALTTGVWDEGARLYWDATAGELTDIVASGVYFFGYALNAKTNGTTTAQAVLRPFVEEGGRLLSLATATTLTAQDFYGGNLAVLTNSTSAGFTITLPAVAGIRAGVELSVYNTAGTNAVTLDGNASQTIGGNATYASIDAAGDKAVVFSTGAAWLIKDATIA